MAPVTESDIEEYEMTVEEMLMKLNDGELKELASGLNIDDNQWKDKRKLLILRSVRRNIEQEVEGRENLKDKKDYLDQVINAIEVVQNLKIGKKDPPKTPATIKRTSSHNSTFIKTDESDEEREHKPWIESLKVLKKDFVIAGKIGEPENEKDIGYLSIVRQMADGVEKGYTESEVVAAVLKAISPRSLRSYLSLKKNLKIPKLSQILRLHYQEKSATELYQELINMKQGKKEDPPAFVIRALETREKILFASKEEGEVSYDTKHVQTLCLSTIDSGIDEEVASIIRPCLVVGIDDIDLMQEVNKAQVSLKMRKQKFELGGRKTGASCSGVMADESEILKTLREVKNSMGSVETLKKEMQELRKEMTGMKIHVDQVNTSNSSRQNNAPLEQQANQTTYNRYQGTQFTPQCFACKQENRDCYHCYKCGSEDHYARGCRVAPGNGRGLSSRGRR